MALHLSSDFTWELKGEKFHYGTEQYNVDLAKQMIIDSPRRTIAFRVKEIIHILPSIMVVQFDVDMTHPIIVNHRNFPIDGWHRLHRAVRTKRKYIEAVVLTPRETERIISYL